MVFPAARPADFVKRPFWFHGFDYNATAASRVAITGTIYNGYVFCLDPEAFADSGWVSNAPTLFPSLPSGMVLKGVGDGYYCANVTKPKTGILPLVAGFATGLPPEGITANDYASGIWIDLVVQAEAAQVYTHANMTYGTTLLGAATAEWSLVALAVGTDGANLHSICAKSLVTADTSSTAANKTCSFRSPIGRW
jgi:hypothetical protein